MADAPVVVTAIAAGSSHTAALASCDVVATWGRGEDGQLGHGNAEQVLRPKAVFDLVGKDVTAIACGAEYTVALTTQAVYSWGWGDFGRLGHGDASDVFRPRPISFFNGQRVNKVACGDTHTLVVLHGGRLYSFGRNQNGQLGIGSTQDSLSPQLVQAMEGQKVHSVACGAEHSVVATEEGQVYAWGWGRYGNLGDGHREDRLLPAQAQGLQGTHIESVVCGWRHSLALSKDGRVYTFGWSKYGQLGHGSQEDMLVPTLVQALADKQLTIVAGGWRHTLAADSQGVVYGWGWNKFGQLGLGDAVDRSSPCVVAFPGPCCVQQLACGWRHTAAITTDGRVFSWGRGVNGQLGHGVEEDAFVPTCLTALCKGVVTRQSLIDTTSASAQESYVLPSDRYAVVPNGSKAQSTGADGAASTAEDASVVPSVPGLNETEPPTKRQR